MARTRLIRDPIYDYIALPPELARIVDHPLFQRLRRVSQTSLTSAVYPAATGTRFEHGLGTMELAQRAWAAVWRNASGKVRADLLAKAQADIPGLPATHDDFRSIVGLAIAFTALLHDVGHPPFSHVLEDTYQELSAQHLGGDDESLHQWSHFGGAFHEFAGGRIARQLSLLLLDPLRATAIQIYESDPDGSTWASALHGIVAGEVDVDRLDYLMRDGRKLGTEFGEIDHFRLIEALELHVAEGGFRVAPGVRARSAVETLLIQRTQSYKWIIFHPRVVGSNLALARAIEYVFLLIQDTNQVTLGGMERIVGDIFQSILPNLNYLRPSSNDVAAVVGHALAAEVDSAAPAQLALGDQAQAGLTAELKLDLQGGVDDFAVIEMLKRGAAVARALLTQGMVVGETRSLLSRLITYEQAVIDRKKNFLPAWKTVEEFAGAAEKMRGPLISAVDGAFDEVCEKYKDIDDVVAPLRERQADWRRLHQISAVAATNELIGGLLSKRENRQLLIGYLVAARDELKGSPGWWDLAYTGFSPVRTRRNLTVLYRGDTAYSLIDHSPLIQALNEVERSRFRLGLFFFLGHPGSVEPWEPGHVRESRELLTGDFIEVFPNFVRTLFAELLRSTISTGGTNDH